jgi:membrane protease subunit HflC
MKKKLITIVIAALLGIIAFLLLFTFQVRQSEVVVVTTFGKPSDSIDKPGLNFRLPPPIQQVYRFDQRTMNFEDKFSQNLTGDGTLLMSSVYVGWRISDAKQFFPKFAGGSIPAAQRQLEEMLRSAKSFAVGKHNLADFVNVDPSQVKFEEIENMILTNVQSQLATHDYGISLEFLGLKRIGLPESVTQTVFDRMKSERLKYISEAQFEGEKRATEIRSTAERQAADLLANANATAISIQGEGQAEAAKSLSVFQQNPQLEVFQLELEALKTSLNRQSSLILDETKPPFDLFRNIPPANENK